MYFLYGAIALWVITQLITYWENFTDYKNVTTFKGWVGDITSTLWQGMLLWFIYSFANAVGTVFGVVFENQAQLAAMIGRGT